MTELILRREARRLVGNISRATEQRLLRNSPDWPRPVKISPGRSGYVLSEVQAYIELQIARRDNQAS